MNVNVSRTRQNLGPRRHLHERTTVSERHSNQCLGQPGLSKKKTNQAAAYGAERKSKIASLASKRRDNTRAKLGTLMFCADQERMWACPFDKFLPGQSDCAPYSMKTEDRLHSYHMKQSHVYKDSQHITWNEYNTISAFRSFGYGERCKLDQDEQDLWHWRRMFVAIYKVFRPYFDELNPYKGEPLLADTLLFERLRREQMRQFDHDGEALPYAYHPQQARLQEMNSARSGLGSQSPMEYDDVLPQEDVAEMTCLWYELMVEPRSSLCTSTDSETTTFSSQQQSSAASFLMAPGLCHIPVATSSLPQWPEQQDTGQTWDKTASITVAATPRSYQSPTISTIFSRTTPNAPTPPTDLGSSPSMVMQRSPLPVSDTESYPSLPTPVPFALEFDTGPMSGGQFGTQVLLGTDFNPFQGDCLYHNALMLDDLDLPLQQLQQKDEEYERDRLRRREAQLAQSGQTDPDFDWEG